jgi:hypothetical protein
VKLRGWKLSGDLITPTSCANSSKVIL